MSNKFSEFLQKSKIDPRRIIAASRQIEKLRPEDRATRLARRRARGGDAAPADGEQKAATEKPRSGRPVTPRLLREVTAGKAIPGPAKQRLLRAVNRILEQKKKDPADLRALF